MSSINKTNFQRWILVIGVIALLSSFMAYTKANAAINWHVDLVCDQNGNVLFKNNEQISVWIAYVDSWGKQPNQGYAEVPAGVTMTLTGASSMSPGYLAMSWTQNGPATDWRSFNCPVPTATATNTATSTTVPPTATMTPEPTFTQVPPTATATNTPYPIGLEVYDATTCEYAAVRVVIATWDQVDVSAYIVYLLPQGFGSSGNLNGPDTSIQFPWQKNTDGTIHVAISWKNGQEMSKDTHVSKPSGCETPVPPTATATGTAVPPTATSTNEPPTATQSPVPNSPTPTFTPTSTPDKLTPVPEPPVANASVVCVSQNEAVISLSAIYSGPESWVHVVDWSATTPGVHPSAEIGDHQEIYKEGKDSNLYEAKLSLEKDTTYTFFARSRVIVNDVIVTEKVFRGECSGPTALDPEAEPSEKLPPGNYLPAVYGPVSTPPAEPTPDSPPERPTLVPTPTEVIVLGPPPVAPTPLP